MRTLKFFSLALILVVEMIFTFQSCQKDETVVVNPNYGVRILVSDIDFDESCSTSDGF